ncbi:DUF885 domain-containing protein [Streptacidiphilus fuscans]|uniref:DUF885 domain-containing protein n=1 Tax=Streptacidiphilus fuscans TaxID=2789292 RepID=A0A931FF52_9ACTN|nr:DUF885 domain-containing protein [Streptacidiphilus fuscans]MBF9068089.1 DUF885 domain-containing protein [Streptacidiphilus fuscans]
MSEAATPRQIADDYVERMAAQDPSVTTWLGLDPKDERLPDFSPEGSAAEARLARETLARLNAFPESGDPAEQACARLLRERLGSTLERHEAGEHYRSVANLHTPMHALQSLFGMMPTATEEDWVPLLARLRKMPEAVAGYRTTLAEGVARRLFAAPRQAEVLATQLDAWTGASSGQGGSGRGNANGNGIGGWLAQLVAPAPERFRDEADAAAAKAGEAVSGLSDWLRESYAPAAAGTPDGVGRERYLLCARAFLGATLDPEQTYAWGWEEFHRVWAELRAEAERVLPGADVEQARAHLNEHGHMVQGAEAMRAWLQGITEEAIEALDGTHFDLSGPLRQVETRIAPAGTAAAPYYSGPSLDFSRPGRTHLPLANGDAEGRFRTWRLVSTWYHEGVPGHHLQLASWVMAADQLSRYQVTLGKISANVEGWALYAERLMDELGFLTDPGRRLGYLGKQMMRIVRVIVDIGMHLRLAIPADSPFHPGERWTPELATAFMSDYVGLPPAARDSEIVRYLGRPGQAIGYKLGERAWLAGRDAARRRLGAEFDLKAWHMKALRQGSFGLDDLVENLAGL